MLQRSNEELQEHLNEALTRTSAAEQANSRCQNVITELELQNVEQAEEIDHLLHENAQLRAALSELQNTRAIQKAHKNSPIGTPSPHSTGGRSLKNSNSSTPASPISQRRSNSKHQRSGSRTGENLAPPFEAELDRNVDGRISPIPTLSYSPTAQHQQQLQQYSPRQLQQPQLYGSRNASQDFAYNSNSGVARSIDIGAHSFSSPKPTMSAGIAGRHSRGYNIKSGVGSMSSQPTHRARYGSVPAFKEIQAAYRSVLGEEDAVQKWVRHVYSSRSAIETDPKKIEPLVDGVCDIFEDNGLPLPLEKTGSCTYKLGSAKTVVRLMNGKLMAKSGPTFVNMFAWIAKQPLL